LTNNDVLRSLRSTLSMNDGKIKAVFASADTEVERSAVKAWLAQENDPGYRNCSDRHLAIFLNGLINEQRGRREGAQPAPEKSLDNNIILRKLKIAFKLESGEMRAILNLAGKRISQHELSAFFRRPGHKHYRECGDQILRSFLKGLYLTFHPDKA